MKKIFKLENFFLCFVFIFFLVSNFFIFSNILILKFSKDKIKSLKSIEKQEYTIIFGASVYGDLVSPILYDRIKKGAEIFEKKKTEKIIVSGFKHSSQNYDEPESMKNVLVQNFGISEEKVLKDDLGSRTFATCNRAKNDFFVDDAILVSQNFHISRAIFLCENLGINSVGIVADGKRNSKDEIREFFARGWSVKDIIFKNLNL